MDKIAKLGYNKEKSVKFSKAKQELPSVSLVISNEEKDQSKQCETEANKGNSLCTRVKIM